MVYLDISDNNIVDINPISELVNLRDLYIRYNPLTNIDVILKLPILAHLSIHGCFNLSNDYYEYVKLYWCTNTIGENDYLVDLKKILTIEKRKRIISEL